MPNEDFTATGHVFCFGGEGTNTDYFNLGRKAAQGLVDNPILWDDVVTDWSYMDQEDPVTTAPSLPANITFSPGTVSSAYDETYGTKATGTEPITMSITAGSLPAGLSLDTTLTDGSIRVHGTPTAEDDTVSWTLQAANAGGSDTQDITTPVTRNDIDITTTDLDTMTIGSAYSDTISASGGHTGNYTWSFAAGTLPPGLALNQVGQDYVLSGTPTTAGSYTFTVQVDDDESRFDTQEYNENSRTAIVISTSSLAGGNKGVAYSAFAQATGGHEGFYTWSISAGSLPAGLTIDGSTGEISGTPTSTGTHTFTVRVEDDE